MDRKTNSLFKLTLQIISRSPSPSSSSASSEATLPQDLTTRAREVPAGSPTAHHVAHAPACSTAVSPSDGGP